MERMPIYQRWIFNKYSHAGPLFYAVLIHLSMSYPPLIGKLHTRYSPVRRSPAIVGKPTIPLPLDLHVLSLSLAFILSQDQTLRCYKLFMSYAQDSVTFRFIKYWRYLFSKYLYYLLIYVIFSKNLVAIVIFDCGCKGKNFYFNLPNFFGSFFCFFSSAFGISLGFTNLTYLWQNHFPLPLHHVDYRISLDCGCKSRTDFWICKIFLEEFLNYF